MTINESALIKAMEGALTPAVRTLSSVLADAGFASWVVGGAVRDVALSLLEARPLKQSGDWDLSTSAEPKQVQALFKRVIPTGIKHGTVTVMIGSHSFEVTTLRGERGHSDGRRPDEVFFVNDINADLARRDFTVNAIAYNVQHRTIHDPYDGMSDLLSKQLRAVGNAAERFAEDGLRVLRCARFSATLNFDIEEQTRRAIRPSLPSFEKVAQERVQQEWLKALSSAHPGRFFATLLDEGLLAVTAPQLVANDETYFSAQETQTRLNHLAPEPIWRMALLVVACTPLQGNAVVQLTSAHERAQMLSERLKLSREQRHLLTLLVAHHLLPDALVSNPTPAQARRYLAAIGRQHITSILDFQLQCARPHGQALAFSEKHHELHALLREQAKSGAPLSLKELKVSGQDLLQAGVPKGPELGQTLNMLLERALEEPELNQQTQLISLARKLNQERPL